MAIQITETEIITDHERIPRFPASRVVPAGETVGLADTTEPFIEVWGTLQIKGTLKTNTITVMPGGKVTFPAKAGKVVFFGEILDQEQKQFGRGIVCLGHLDAVGVEVATPWTESDGQFSVNEERSIEFVGQERAHVMITGEGSCNVQYCKFDQMDRTTTALLAPVVNQIGRYQLHFHHLKTQGSTIHGNLFTRFLKWACTVHGTHGHRVTKNVFLGDGEPGLSQGAGLVTEDGSETGHTITDNLAIGIWGEPAQIRPQGDNGFEGSGFWFAGTTNCTIDRNIAVDCRHGFVDFTPGREGRAGGITPPGGANIPRSKLFPASWTANRALRCHIGLDVYGSSTLDPWWYVDQEFVACGTAAHLRTFHHYFRNPTVLDCTGGFSDFGYVGLLTIDGGRIENCGQGSNMQDLKMTNCQLINNGMDWQVQTGFGKQVWIEAKEMPKIKQTYFAGQSTNSAGVANAYTVIAIGGKYYIILDHSALPSARFPDEDRNVKPGVFFDPSITNSEAFAGFSLYPNHHPIDASKVTHHPNVTDFWGKQLPIIELDAPPVRPKMEPRCRIHRRLPHLNWVSYTLVGMEGGDVAQLYVNGTLRTQNLVAYEELRRVVSYRGLLTVFGQKDTDEMELRLVRKGVTIASHKHGSVPPDDPNEELKRELEQLKAKKAALEAQIVGLQADVAAIQERIEEIEAILAGG